MISYGKHFIDEDDIKAVVEVLRGDYLTTGAKVDEFEEALCKTTGAKYAVAVANGTAALHISALALFSANDEVLVSPNTFVASANAILYANAKPIFCDVGEDGNMDLDVARKICEEHPNIKCVVAVHFSGRPLDLAKLKALKDDFGLKIIEDGAHALGMQDLGSVSDCAILSFHPVKHITTGEGGAIITNNKELAEKIKTLRTHGIVRDNFKNKTLAYDKSGLLNPWYYEMQELGFNYRITDFACALGLSQIKKLDAFLLKRKELAKKYEEELKNTPNIKLLYSYDERSSYHLFVVLIDFEKLGKTKAELFNYAKERGIALQTHYIPVNAQAYYAKLGYNYLDTPNALKYYEQAVSLPLYYALKDDEFWRVIGALKDFIL